MSGIGIGISPIFLTKPSTYKQKVLSYSPVAYWPLDETSGTNADNAEGTAARDGTYTGATLADDNSGSFGTAAPRFDGANDVVNIYSASLNSVFDPTDAFTIAFWIKSADSIATSSDRAFNLGADGSNNTMALTIASTELRCYFVANGTSLHADIDVTDVLTPWFHAAWTVDISDDELKAFKNGSQEDVTITGLGNWSGSLASSLCAIAAANSTPNNVFNGWIAHTAIFGTALNATQILDLATT